MGKCKRNVAMFLELVLQEFKCWIQLASPVLYLATSIVSNCISNPILWFKSYGLLASRNLTYVELKTMQVRYYWTHLSVHVLIALAVFGGLN